MNKIIIFFISGFFYFFSILTPVRSQEQFLGNTQLPVIPNAGNANIQSPVTNINNTELSMFGENFFKFSKNYDQMLIMSSQMFPESYRLGSGDRLGVYLLEKAQQNFEVVVNVEGKIFIPTVGVLYVADLTISEFQKFLEKKLAKYYDNYSVDVMLIEPKHIPVLVVGDVNQPGKYYLSALNTVLDAVVAAGGPTKNGSLRNIEVYRDDALFTVVDLYEFLMKGNIDYDIFLQPYDKVVVPLSGSIVAVEGEVKRPAKFELKRNGGEKLSDVMKLAGEFTDLAFLNKIEVSRLLPDGEREVVYIDYHEVMDNDSSDSNIRLKNDDHIRVFSIEEQINPKYVFIHGEVRRPGEYILEENLRVLDLILKAGNLTRSAYLLECEVAKIDPKLPTKYKKIDLKKLLENPASEDNILLEEDDRLFIRKIPEWEVGPTIEIVGEVKFPGIYAITKDSTSLLEIIEKAGGFTDEALIREGVLIRKSSKITIDKEYERLKQLSREQMSETEYQYLVMKENTSDIGRIVVDFYKLFVGNDLTENVVLEKGDIIRVPKAPKVVYVTGRVSKPGGVVYKAGEDIRYYLERAGGPTWDAKVKDIKVTKVTGEILDDEDVKDLMYGDIIWVPRRPDRDWWEIFRQTIAVVAQVATVYLVVDRAVKN